MKENILFGAIFCWIVSIVFFLVAIWFGRETKDYIGPTIVSIIALCAGLWMFFCG